MAGMMLTQTAMAVKARTVNSNCWESTWPAPREYSDQVLRPGSVDRVVAFRLLLLLLLLTVTTQDSSAVCSLCHLFSRAPAPQRWINPV